MCATTHKTSETRLLAAYQYSPDQEDVSGSSDAHKARFCKSAQWTPDGTCVVANTSDSNIQTFVIPPDLLDERPKPQDLKPYCVTKSSESISALAIYPYFDLQDPLTNLALSAANEHPIRLISLASTQLLASYPLVNPTTEAMIRPNTLLFSSDGAQFLAGSDSCISAFDVSRPGQGPVTSLQTGPKSANSYTNLGTSMRGLISAMAVDEQYNVLAAGTYGRHVGLYDSAGRGDCLGVFCVQGTEADKSIQGQGITQLSWSTCGRYLFIAERRSGGIMFYDIRKTGQLLGWLEGRDAYTNQRMLFDLAQNLNNGAVEIWAGGLDGQVRTWKNPSDNEGGMAPDTTVRLHKDAVNSVGKHKSGDVLVTACGQRHFDQTRSESSISLWTL